MKLMTILNEIGNRILIPTTNVYGWGGGKSTFNIDDVKYEIEIEPNDSISVSSTIERFPSISIAFRVAGKREYDQTNKNVPLQIMSYIIGAFETFSNDLLKKSSKTTEIQFNSIVYSSPDSRRLNMYNKFIENYCKTKNCTVTFQTADGGRVVLALFDPYIKFTK
jgi:hypothetical protein